MYFGLALLCLAIVPMALCENVQKITDVNQVAEPLQNTHDELVSEIVQRNKRDPFGIRFLPAIPRIPIIPKIPKISRIPKIPKIPKIPTISKNIKVVAKEASKVVVDTLTDSLTEIINDVLTNEKPEE